MSSQVPMKLDWSPFEVDKLYQLGQHRNWPEVFRILRPVTNPQFAVTDAVSRAVVDAVRRELDAAFNDEKLHVIGKVLLCNSDGDAEVIKELLACGANPDVPDSEGWRPSHTCGCWGRFDAAQAVFLCRPDMNAKNKNGHTPLQAAAEASYTNDEKYPARAAMRTFAHEFIKNGEFESRFPNIAELAVQKKWFALKNLLRRQVVPQEEFAAKYREKTAAEWAECPKEELIAKEIQYYEQRMAVRLSASASQFLEASIKLSKLTELEAENARLVKEGTDKDERMAELSETVEALTAQLQEYKTSPPGGKDCQEEGHAQELQPVD